MNRELKFRVWYGKEFSYFSLGETNRYPSNGMEFPVQQFTGLKDRIGKEIYFGDLAIAPSGNIFEVIWYDEEMRIALRNKDTIYNYNVSLYEVCGNIHENPELL